MLQIMRFVLMRIVDAAAAVIHLIEDAEASNAEIQRNKLIAFVMKNT